MGLLLLLLSGISRHRASSMENVLEAPQLKDPGGHLERSESSWGDTLKSSWRDTLKFGTTLRKQGLQIGGDVLDYATSLTSSSTTTKQKFYVHVMSWFGGENSDHWRCPYACVYRAGHA